jgi:hypothetical protein
MSSEWCAFCVSEIHAAGFTFKERHPQRAVTEVEGTACCLSHVGPALDKSGALASIPAALENGFLEASQIVGLAFRNLAAKKLVDRERILNAIHDGRELDVEDFPGAWSIRVDGLQVLLIVKADSDSRDLVSATTTEGSN